MSYFYPNLQKTKRVLWSIVTSGLPPDTDLDTLRKHFLLNPVAIVGIFFTGLLSTIGFFQEDYLVSAVDFFVMLILVSLVFYLRKTKDHRTAGIAGTLACGFFYFFLVSYGGKDHSTYVWAFTYPLIVLQLLGKQLGTYMSFSLLTLCCVSFSLRTRFEFFADYSNGLVIRFITAYITIHMMGLIMEVVRENIQNRLVGSNSKLKMSFKKVQKISQDLSASNKKLHAEIEERKLLKDRLARAQKMEAVGTLAGGVAHDLNNILSGIVSYPDLLLMDIPKDNPMRDALITIQKSGQKAAAIVQDLLTLTRRGVPISEAVNLNDIVANFIDSPECRKIKEYHPNVEIEVSLQTGLPMMMGSTVHLFKTLMNLVSNAAESMPRGGIIKIDTTLKKIKEEIIGYEKIPTDKYVVLSVADSGSGISSDDLSRIFEHFYTKKTMGRSGTGLGMTVVWGTVKDHKGFLDVHSKVRVGSTFCLYFPMTNKKQSLKKESIAVKEYMGNERILVIDDVPEQREIASAMLEKLGYHTAAAKSGEDAIGYLKTKTADLLLIDMIMEPGLDGVETFKKVLQLHPNQKAIIATGYSDSSRIKKAQDLGAGRILKKPYDIEELGVTVRAELNQYKLE